MPYSIQPGSPEESILKIDYIVFDEISFVRKGFRNEASAHLDIKVNVSVKDVTDDRTRVTLSLFAEKESEYEAKISASCFCAVADKGELGQEILRKNVTAILFPYVRTELTLLTSQPETDPIVLPAMNINGLVNNMVSE